ncbi:hypothetical protein FIBSPDRAFT_1050967, partial [Athelia psychrophila]
MAGGQGQGDRSRETHAGTGKDQPAACRPFALSAGSGIEQCLVLQHKTEKLHSPTGPPFRISSSLAHTSLFAFPHSLSSSCYAFYQFCCRCLLALSSLFAMRIRHLSFALLARSQLENFDLPLICRS